MVGSMNGECRGAAASCNSSSPLTAASAQAAAAKSCSVRLARPASRRQAWPRGTEGGRASSLMCSAVVPVTRREPVAPVPHSWAARGEPRVPAQPEVVVRGQVDEPVVVRAAGHQTASYPGLVAPRGGLAEQFEWV